MSFPLVPASFTALPTDGLRPPCKLSPLPLRCISRNADIVTELGRSSRTCCNCRLCTASKGGQSWVAGEEQATGRVNAYAMVVLSAVSATCALCAMCCALRALRSSPSTALQLVAVWLGSVALQLQPVGAHALLGDDQDLHVVALQNNM